MYKLGVIFAWSLKHPIISAFAVAGRAEPQFACAIGMSSFHFLLLFLSSYVSLSASQNETPTTGATSDRLALLSFKALISDDPFGALASWDNESLQFCQWQGVTCGDNSSHQLRVTALELESFDLAGMISPSISNLTFLRRLHLSDNRLEGPIPRELGLLSHLQHLNLSDNILHGTIPRDLGQCLELEVVDLADNKLEGGIPSELGSLSKLELLLLWNNSLTGSIPQEIGNLANLTRLFLNENQFTGTIPVALGNLSSLVALDLSSNQLTGAIPKNLSRYSRLKFIDFSNNTFEGEIPSDFGSLLELEVLSLWGNHLTGTIPPEVGNLVNLIKLGLHENHLTGTVPSQIGNLVNLNKLYLLNNNLSGSVPPEIGKLVSLTELRLDTNQLTGTVPSEIGNLVNLTVLDLLSNRLVGTVPASIGNLTSLTYLGLSMNYLGGVIPPSIWNLSYLTILELQGNSFIGSIPPDIGLTLPLLEALDINENQFSGPLPISLPNASNLNNIQLYNNNFTGIVPRGLGSLQSLFHFDLGYNYLEARNAADWGFVDDLANCSSLKYFELTSNKFGGMLPRSIANFSRTLEWIKIDDNYITGSIPAEIGNLISLAILQINNNLLTGIIPATLGSLRRLQIIDLSGNYFTGGIPTSLGNLNRLTELHLSSNQLQGCIPASLGNCSLDLMDLSHNKLSGTLPKEIMSIPTLTKVLNVSHNSLSGSLPSEVGQMENLGGFDISVNRLTGTIPSSLGECQQLVYLRMAGNFFQGPIPSSFRQLKGLQSLDLSRNNLSGGIPEFLGSFKFLSYLNLSFNNFEGKVPEDGIFRNLTALSVRGNSKLCGGDQHLNLPSCPTQSSRKKHLSRKLLVTISVASGTICLILLLTLFSTACWIRKSKKDPHAADCIKDQHLKVSYAELLRATNGFSTTNLIGAGSFGSVYKGLLNCDEDQVVAVKVLNLQQRGASRSFIAECEALRNIRHRNLVKIITACASTDFRGHDFKALIYEFMTNGSLEKWLHPEASEQCQIQKFGLLQRLNILIDAASALNYLHHHGAESIVHCDIKPSNVLLDDNMVAHLGDFGLARFINRVPVEAIQRSYSSVILKGSIGYVAPEYGVANKVSVEGDVYSYGILLLELLTGKRPTNETFKGGISLPQYVEMALPEQVIEIMDPNLNMVEEGEEANDRAPDIDYIRKKAVECVTLSLRIGIKCTKDSPQERMQIADVITELAAIRNAYLEFKNKV